MITKRQTCIVTNGVAAIQCESKNHPPATCGFLTLFTNG